MEYSSFIPQAFIIIAFALGLYLVLIRPQQLKLRRHEQLLASIVAGDRVVTASGFIGRIVSTHEDGSLTLELSAGVHTTIMRWAVNDVLSRQQVITSSDADSANLIVS